MQRDFRSFQRQKLTDPLSAFIQAKDDYEHAKEGRDIDKQKRAEEKKLRMLLRIVQEEPHVAYLAMKAEGYKDAATDIQTAWRDACLEGSLAAQEGPGYADLGLFPDPDQLARLPELSCLLVIPFKLKKAYISRDENDFHILDNPLRREKIFRNPLVASTTWKGALRAALWQLGRKEDDAQIIRLFGNPRGSEDGMAGRVHFYSSFFERNQATLEVINPHERNTGIGTVPISIEAVKTGSVSHLRCLYIPFGLTSAFGSANPNNSQVRRQVAEDLILLAQGLLDMLTIYGFGAKTSSGFGVIEDRLPEPGRINLRCSVLAEKVVASAATGEVKEAAVPELPRYLEAPDRLQADFRAADGSLISEAQYQALLTGRGQQYSKSNRQIYEKARKWWERRQSPQPEPPAPEETAEAPAPQPVVCREFSLISELVMTMQEVTRDMQKGDDL